MCGHKNTETKHLDDTKGKVLGQMIETCLDCGMWRTVSPTGVTGEWKDPADNPLSEIPFDPNDIARQIDPNLIVQDRGPDVPEGKAVFLDTTKQFQAITIQSDGEKVCVTVDPIWWWQSHGASPEEFKAMLTAAFAKGKTLQPGEIIAWHEGAQYVKPRSEVRHG